jgi:MoaA/NifB/PqqE/SkfB family radical SAM enzyme
LGPEALHIELLHACPNKCLACEHGTLGPARLKPAALRTLYRLPELKQLKLVSFSGGEPLLYPGLAAVLTGAAAAFPGAAIVLLSSLHDPAKALKLLRSLPPAVLGRLHVGSSLDGPEAVHDEMRGREGSFAALKRSLTEIRKEFPRLSAGLTFTATRRNAAAFYSAWNEARALGLFLAPQFLVPNANTAGLDLDVPARKALAAGLHRALGECQPASRQAADLRQALDFLAGGPAGPCGAGGTFLMLAPEGEFYLCPFHKDIRAPLPAAQRLRPPAGGHRTRHCSTCFLRCAR